MLMKLGKVLFFCRFLFATMGLTVHRTWQNRIGGEVCSCN